MGIEVLFLDVDDTLLDFGKCAKRAMEAAAEQMGLSLPVHTEPTFHRINDGLWQEIQSGALTTEELYRVRWNRIFAALELDADGLAFEHLFVALLADIAEPVDGAIELLSYLRGRYTLCIASNAPYEQQVRRLTAAEMLPFFSQLFISEKIGCAKPQKAFFDACRNAFPSLSPTQMLMLGDSVSADMTGAHACGMQTCWFNKKKHNKNPGFVDYSVTDLAECRLFL